MKTLDSRLRSAKARMSAEVLLVTIAVLAGIVLLRNLFSDELVPIEVLSGGIIITLAATLLVRITLNPDKISAEQTDRVLKLASQTLNCMETESEQTKYTEICKIVLPSTLALAVAITDDKVVLGFAGHGAREYKRGEHITAASTQRVIESGKPFVLLTENELNFSSKIDGLKIKCAIMVPITVSGKAVAVLKFYYDSPHKITESQRSVAIGLGELLSTQFASAELEEKIQLAHEMELKALQYQINPHFLFNTLNTIAALIRTDPANARMLLREFSFFYRSTLENSQDTIELSQELEQVRRYFTFELARFGVDQLELLVDVPEEVEMIPVPSFLVQPLVENAVKHGRIPGKLLTISVQGSIDGNDAIITVSDNGVGMREGLRDKVLFVKRSEGTGIGLKNVSDRVAGFFNNGSLLTVDSVPGVGTSLVIRLKDVFQIE